MKIVVLDGYLVNHERMPWKPAEVFLSALAWRSLRRNGLEGGVGRWASHYLHKNP